MNIISGSSGGGVMASKEGGVKEIHSSKDRTLDKRGSSWILFCFEER